MPRMFKQGALEKVLKDLCKQGKFKAAALASADGLLITSAGPEVELMAALAAQLPVMVGRLPRLAPVDEIVIHGRNDCQLVCRYFTSRGDALILLVLTRAGVAYLRRVNQAMRQLQSVWERPLT